MIASRIFVTLCVMLTVAPTLTSGFSLMAVITRRGKQLSTKAVPSKSLEDFNAQMMAIVAEERRDHYHPYVQQTVAFRPVGGEALTKTTSS